MQNQTFSPKQIDALWRLGVRAYSYVAGDPAPLHLSTLSVPRGVKFHYFNFDDSVLRRVDWRKADMVNVAFRFSLMEDMNFVHSDFTSANFYGSTLSQVNLSHSNLSKAKMGRMTVDDSRFSYTRMNEVMSDFCVFTRTDFSGAVSKSGDSSRTQFINCDFSHATFNSCDFSGAVFTHCTFNRTIIEHSRISNAKFVDCDLADAFELWNT